MRGTMGDGVDGAVQSEDCVSCGLSVMLCLLFGERGGGWGWNGNGDVNEGLVVVWLEIGLDSWSSVW